MEAGEYAIRGGVIDLFALGFKRPFRLDLFGSEIESIRFFDTETQRSLESVDQLDILPAHEFPMTDEGIDLFRANFRTVFEGDPHLHLIYREVSKGNIPNGLDHFFPLFFSQTSTIFDYIPPDSCWIADSDLTNQADALWAQIVDRYNMAAGNEERRPLAPEHLYLTPKSLQQQLFQYRSVSLSKAKTQSDDIRFSCKLPEEVLVEPESTDPYSSLINRITTSKNRLLLTTQTLGRMQAFDELLTQRGIRTARVKNWDDWMSNPEIRVGLLASTLDRGMLLPEEGIEVITEAQLYRDYSSKAPKLKRESSDAEVIIRSLAELSVGDPVVHEEQGVGRYRGLQTLRIDEQDTEFLVLEYQGADKLYVPILSLQLVSRYVGGNSESAPLHKLGTDVWDKTKKRAQGKVYDVAVELLETNALRASGRGYHFNIPTSEYRDFVNRFPFEETPDQIRVIMDILNDLTSDKPMDRLVCGDVGFGKTEVALRATFIAVHNQKQVALLVPTTILAQQHFDTFRDRFSQEAIQIEVLSRFRNTKEIDAILAKLPNGYPDIIIGTHRLLQEDVRFQDLGLLIIDEEHRFGVRQKEKLKRLRETVDVLSLTATPIPRTLNIGLAGLRSISLISTPPLDRRSIKTFVCTWNDNVVREACVREIHRGGQIFFLHNEVRSIDKVGKQLAALVPEGLLRIAHGQMPKRKLEKVMEDFYHQRFNMLICTTIIESGIDLPSANTIIINRADKFGLAQLHQLRGRVGRSHHQAYAYLITPNLETLSDNAQRRIEAITKLEELGSGFMLASHDLEIRGAGELLGESQSGAIDEIGFSLDSEYLKRAIQDVIDDKSYEKTSYPTSPWTPADLRFNVPALFPDSYLPDVHARLVFYKRIASVEDPGALYELELESLDRFGSLPESAQSLFRIRKMQLYCHSLGIQRFLLDQNGGRLEFDSSPTIDPRLLLTMFEDHPGVFRMINSQCLQIQKPLVETQERLMFAEWLLKQLSA
jgi:transcription-repair coupling factor (superfamily II helicase)